MQFAAQDCQLLARFQESMPWNNAAESDRNAIKDLWNRLKHVAIEAAKQYSGSTEVKRFLVAPNPEWPHTERTLGAASTEGRAEQVIRSAGGIDRLGAGHRDLFLPWLRNWSDQQC